MAASRLRLAVGLALLLAACQKREPPEVARDRAAEVFLQNQITSLQALIAKAERGELVTKDRIAIGIAEQTVKELLDASLPQEQKVANRVRVRLESAQPIFRGNTAALLFQASAVGETGVSARLELGGELAAFRIEKGKLIASVRLSHFKVLDTSLGDIAGDVLESLVRDNLDRLSGMIPNVEIPVHLEESIKIAGLEEGVVTVAPGALPLVTSVAEVIPVNARLWILLEAKAGPWQKVARTAKKP